MAVRMLNLIGDRYAKLTVVSLSDERTKEGKPRWVCRCDCGTLTTVDARNLRSGSIKSCGCHRQERAANLTATHHLSKTPEHEAWRQLRSRCTNPDHPNYENYGGRGITVCPEWDSFERFLADMGPRPSARHSIDRFPDNDGPYAPGNCRWATQTEQHRNKRSNTLLTHNGRSMTIAAWSEETGLSLNTICERLRRGWSVARALTDPLDHAFSATARRRSTKSSALQPLSV